MVRFNLVLVSVYAVFSIWFFSIKPGYGLLGPSIFLVLFSVAYFILVVLSIVKGRTEEKLMTLACWFNLVPLVLGIIFFLMSTFAPSVLYLSGGLGDHAPLIIFASTLFVAVGGAVVSFVLFSIAYFKKSNVIHSQDVAKY